MANCEFCKNMLQPKSACPCCGTVISSATATFIYGQSDKASSGCAINVTNKFLIIRSVSKSELASMTGAASMGLIGAVIGEAINSSIKKVYAYYDLTEIQKVIYPYHNYKLKKDTAIKFVNRDGTDFIIVLNMNGLFSPKAARNFVNGLMKVGLQVEDGSAVNHGYEFCSHPFVNESTFSTRVCSSAATFVQHGQKQFIAPVISNNQFSNSAPQGYQPPIQAQTVNQPNLNRQPFEQPVPRVTPQPTPSIAEQPVQYNVNTVKEPAKVDDSSKLCPGCGKQVTVSDKFCGNCGHAIQRDSESGKETETATWNVDKWKNQW